MHVNIPAKKTTKNPQHKKRDCNKQTVDLEEIWTQCSIPAIAFFSVALFEGLAQVLLVREVETQRLVFWDVKLENKAVVAS